MELRQLEYFREIASTGSINEAARHLNMSQPPLSYQIRQLENELYVKNEEGISNLKLSDRLPTDQAWLSGINDITKDGVYFTYQEKYIGEKEIEGDLLMYDAYIEKEDLFGKTGEMKVIYTPRVSSAGNIVTEE